MCTLGHNQNRAGHKVSDIFINRICNPGHESPHFFMAYNQHINIVAMFLYFFRYIFTFRDNDFKIINNLFKTISYPSKSFNLTAEGNAYPKSVFDLSTVP